MNSATSHLVVGGLAYPARRVTRSRGPSLIYRLATEPTSDIRVGDLASALTEADRVSGLVSRAEGCLVAMRPLVHSAPRPEHGWPWQKKPDTRAVLDWDIAPRMPGDTRDSNPNRRRSRPDELLLARTPEIRAALRRSGAPATATELISHSRRHAALAAEIRAISGRISPSNLARALGQSSLCEIDTTARRASAWWTEPLPDRHQAISDLAIGILQRRNRPAMHIEALYWILVADHERETRVALRHGRLSPQWPPEPSVVSRALAQAVRRGADCHWRRHSATRVFFCLGRADEKNRNR